MVNLLSLKSLLILSVTIVYVANANFFQTVEDKLFREAKVVKNRLHHHDVDQALGSIGRRWSSLRAAVNQMSIPSPFTLISPQKNKKILTGSNLGFSWSSCGPADQLVEIKNLTILPDPLFFPGDLSFGFDITFHDTIPYNAKVSANLLLQYSSRGKSWVTIPCVGNIGSCTYDDICSLSQAIPCPSELKELGIPCTCPINKGEYKLNIFKVEVDASIFLSGDYRAKVSFTDSVKGQIACYQVTFVVG